MVLKVGSRGEVWFSVLVASFARYVAERVLPISVPTMVRHHAVRLFWLRHTGFDSNRFHRDLAQQPGQQVRQHEIPVTGRIGLGGQKRIS